MKPLALPICLVSLAVGVSSPQGRAEDGLEAADAPPAETVVIGPADANSINDILANSDPSRPLEIVCLEGEYILDGAVYINRSAVTIRAADPDARPHFLPGTYPEEGYFKPPFMLNYVSDVRLQGLDMGSLLQTFGEGVMAYGSDRVTVEDCSVYAYWYAFFGSGGRDLAVLGNTLVSSSSPIAGSDAFGVEFTGNELMLAASADSGPYELTVFAPYWPPTEEQVDGVYFVFRDNHIVSVAGSNALELTAYGPTWIEGNRLDTLARTGMSVRLIDTGRVYGRPPPQLVISDNSVHALTTGIVAMSEAGITLRDNEISLDFAGAGPLQELLLGEAGGDTLYAGLATYCTDGRAEITGNVVSMHFEAPGTTFGIYHAGPRAAPYASGTTGGGGLDRIADNRVEGGYIGIWSDTSAESSVEILDNEVRLGLFGHAAIAAARAGGSNLAAALYGRSADEFTDHALTIAGNSVMALEPTGLFAPVGIEAWSRTWATGSSPLVVEDNTLVGTFVTGISVFGTPAVVRWNQVVGNFGVGISTVEFAALGDIESAGLLGTFAGSLASSYLDSFGPLASSVYENGLRLTVRRRGVVGVVTEPGAVVYDNELEFGSLFPWRR